MNHIRENIKDDIFNDLGEAIDDIFAKYQKELNIESGDVTPYEMWEMGDLADELADYITKILDAQAHGRKNTD